MNEFITEVKKFNFNGRLNRAKYWKFFFYCFLSNIVIAIVLSILSVPTKATSAINFLIGILFLPFSVRRLHDLNKSGWWMLICLIPIVNIFFGIYFGFFKGTEGPNNYGEDPLAPQGNAGNSVNVPPVVPLPDDDGIDAKPVHKTEALDVRPQASSAKIADVQPSQKQEQDSSDVQQVAPVVNAAGSVQQQSRPKFCPHCGAPLEQGSKFCGNCGSKL